MARNLCASGCCGVTVNLSDLRGKPIEFRRYAKDSVHIGAKWTCPKCQTEYFAFFRDTSQSGYRSGGWYPGFTIDLSYYESFNDEHGELEPGEKPWHLCEDDATDIFQHWGFTGGEDGDVSQV